MLGGVDGTGQPCKSIEEKALIILNENPHYKRMELVDVPTCSVNTRKAMLIVDVKKKKKKDKEQEFLDKALIALEAGGMAAVKDLCRNTKGKTAYVLYAFIEEGLHK